MDCQPDLQGSSSQMGSGESEKQIGDSDLAKVPAALAK